MPCSRSRVSASAVIITKVMESTMPSRPGTMFRAVMFSGLWRRWMTISNGGVPEPAMPAAAAPLRSCASA